MRTIAEIIKGINDETMERLAYLRSRWADESEYEDWTKYESAIAEALRIQPNEILGSTKRPFGIKVRTTHNNITGCAHIKLIVDGQYLALQWQFKKGNQAEVAK